MMKNAGRRYKSGGKMVWEWSKNGEGMVKKSFNGKIREKKLSC